MAKQSVKDKFNLAISPGLSDEQALADVSRLVKEKIQMALVWNDHGWTLTHPVPYEIEDQPIIEDDEPPPKRYA